MPEREHWRGFAPIGRARVADTDAGVSAGGQWPARWRPRAPRLHNRAQYAAASEGAGRGAGAAGVRPTSE